MKVCKIRMCGMRVCVCVCVCDLHVSVILSLCASVEEWLEVDMVFIACELHPTLD